MNWITDHWESLIAIIGGLVIAARLIVKLTPTPRDDAFLAKLITILKHIGLYIPLLLISGLTSCATDNGTATPGYYRAGNPDDGVSRFGLFLAPNSQPEIIPADK